jgi:PPM family protein phosphatase
MARVGQIAAALRTDQGQIRDHNEDFVAFWEPGNAEEEAENGRLYIVADGVGGAEAGEVASRYAAEQTVHHFLAGKQERDWGKRLGAAMQAANLELRRMVADLGNGRMATTMVAAVVHNQNQATVANVGDSRAYLLRDGRLQQITRDQSLVARLVEEGAITAEEAVHHPRKNVILHSLGSENAPPIDIFHLFLEQEDVLLLCSDGLTRHLSDEEIATISQTKPPDDATEEMVRLANERGGEDNISVVVLRFGLAQAKANAAEVAVSQATVPSAQKIRRTKRAPQRAQGRVFLWFYTVLLCLLQSAAIFVIWLVLRI